MKRILLSAGKIVLIGMAGLFLCVACGAGVKDQYKTLYKTTTKSQVKEDGAYYLGTMPFYKEEKLHIAIEWDKSPAKSFYHFTVLHQYEQHKDLAETKYFLGEMSIQVNGKTTALRQGSSKEWTKKPLSDTVSVVERMVVPLDDAMVQSLRDCSTLSLTVLGTPKNMSAEAIEKIKSFIKIHTAW